MKSSFRSFLLILGVSSFGFVLAAALASLLFRGEGVDLGAPLLGVTVEALLFLVVTFLWIAPLGKAYTYDFASCDDPDEEGPGGFRKALEAIGGAPLMSLIRMFLLVIAFAVGAGLWGWDMGLTDAGRVEFAILVLSLGMLAGAFVFVIADGLGLKTLLSSSVTCFPAGLRENRQQRKIFIIPVFMSLMSLLFAFATAFLLAGRPEIPGLGKWGMILLLSVFYLGVVLTLVGRWNVNTARLYRSVLVQLDQLTQAEKNLTGRISIGSVDEIASISGRVNAFCEGLSEGLKEVAATHGELETVQQKLFGGIGQASGATQDIGVSIEATLAAVERADGALTESRSHARELAVHTADATAKITDQAARVEASTQGVESVMKAVGRLSQDVAGARTLTEDLNRVVQQGEEGLRSLVETVNAVASRSTDLEKVNKLIAGVAARTNLLAMNAAIEAAHAGDAGRGFSVVAEEIRTLAESTADHTRHSRQSLSDILSSIQGALEAARAAGESFTRVRQAADQVSLVTKAVSADMGQEERRSADILKLLAETEELGRSVAASTKALDDLAGTTAGKLDSASSDQSEARRLAKVMTDRNRDLDASMSEVNDQAQKTQEINQRLAAFLRSFKT